MDRRLAIDKLRAILSYDPETGLFRRLVAVPNCHIEVGDIVGRVNRRGYVCIVVGSRPYFAHQLAHAFMTGTWAASVDHRDLNKQNNRWANLRPATPLQQNANRAAFRDGLKGVTKKNGRFQAQIKLHGKNLYLGLFDSEVEAAAAYARKAAELFGEFARAA